MTHNKAVQRFIPIQADENGNLPSAIHLLSVGHWHTPWHGAFEHTTEDLAEMVEHFDGSIGLLLNKKTNRPEAPVNYGHDRGGKAAGWLTELYLDNDGTELWGRTTWTKEGQRALKEGEYKYISPEWNPRDFPWEDPEEDGVFVENVFVGAALTNIPLFKKLQPVMASAGTGRSDKANQPEGGDMDLEVVRKKSLAELNDEEKAFLEEHKADLTDDERTTFELAEGEGAGEGQGEGENGEGAGEGEGEGNGEGQGSDPKQASQVAIAKDELAQLRADAAAGREAQQQLLRAQLQADVTKHVERGAIKADQTSQAVGLLMGASEKQRKELQSFLASLPDNKLIGKEVGDSGKSAGSAIEQLREKTQAILKASAEAGNSIDHGQALSQARRENPDLAKEADAGN